MQFGRKMSHFALSILLGAYALGSKPSLGLETYVSGPWHACLHVRPCLVVNYAYRHSYNSRNGTKHNIAGTSYNHIKASNAAALKGV